MLELARRSFLAGTASTLLLAGESVATPLPTSCDVVVIGGGVAGLTALNDLRKQGLNVFLLEASGRLGGRVHSERKIGKHPLERGAYFVAGSKIITWDTIRSAGLHAVPFPYHGYDSYYGYFDGRWIGRLGDPSTRLDNTGRRYSEVWKQFQKAAADPTSVDKTVQAVFDQLGFDRHLQEVIVAVSTSGMLADPDELSASFYGQTTNEASVRGEGFFQVLEGYDAVASAMGRPNGDCIRLNSTVELIKWSPDGADVTFVEHGVRRSVHCRRLLVTVPLGVLKAGTIKFDPPLPEPKQTAINSLRMGPAVKPLLVFNEPFWKQKYPDVAFIASDLNSAHWMSLYDNWNNDGQAALGGFISGKRAEAVGGMCDEQIIDMCLKDLATMFPGENVRRQFHAGAIANWVADPLARGGYSSPSPGYLDARLALASPVFDTLFWGGEATSGGACVDCAIHTGHREAMRIGQAHA